MTGTLGVVAVTLGLDSARAAAALALHPAASGRAVRFALAFGACDGVASLLGLVAGAQVIAAVEPRADVGVGLLLGAYGLWLAVEPFAWAPGAPLWLPAALSLDNLGAGVVLADTGPPYVIAMLLGVTSFALAGLGFCAGRIVRTRVAGLGSRAGGVALMAIAISQAAGVG